MNKKLLVPLMALFSAAVFAAGYHIHYTETTVFQPHTKVWFDYVVRTELNTRKAQYKPYDRVYIYSKSKLTISRFLPSGNFDMGALGIDEGRTFDELFGGSSRRDGRDSDIDKEIRLSGRSEEEYLRFYNDLNRRYENLRGSINARCSGTIPNNPDCDR